MPKQIQSWSKPEDIPNLIARKKVDYSIFSPGSIYISRSFKTEFIEANHGVELKDGDVQKITLIVNGKEFNADLRCNYSPNSAGERKENLQIRYDGSVDFKKLLFKEFTYSDQYIRNEQERNGKTNVKLPDDIAEYIDFYKTDKPFKYKLKFLKTSAQMMGYPFRNIFNNPDEVRWTFSYIRKMLLGVGIESSDSESFCISLREDINAIHVNFQAWRLFGIRKPETSGLIIELACKDKYAEQLSLTKAFDFKQPDNEDSIGIYSTDFSYVNKNERIFETALLDTWDSIRQRFSVQTKTQYINNNIQDLAYAIFDEEILEYIIENGLDIKDQTIEYLEIPTNVPKAWIFQANPKFYNIELAVKKIKTITWSISKYKDKIKTGDKAYIWISGKDSGVIAAGTIKSDPALIMPSTEDLSYSLNQRLMKEGILRVQICIESLIKPRISKETIMRNSILKNMHIIKNPIGTNFYITPEQANALNEIIVLNNSHKKTDIQVGIQNLSTEIINETNNEFAVLNPSYTYEQCASELGIDENTVEGWIRSIERKKQAILYGPPGTGKTYSARKLAQLMAADGDGIVEIIQFHPAYAYEDFIMGIRPFTKNGVLTYEFKNGIFVNFCEQAKKRKGNCVLIIDEINRANLSRVFGELMYLLEYNDKEIPLANGSMFSIPPNVYIIGTMNSADRSIAIVDHALRRRFAFIKVNVNYDILEKFHVDSNFPIRKLIQLLKRVNDTINDSRYYVGISYFLKKNLSDDISYIWEMEIMPYLEEYFFDQPEKVKEFYFDQVEDMLS